MSKVIAKPMSGFQELSLKKQIIFDKIKRTIEKTFEEEGFFSIDTPAIERWEVLNGKGGEENQKLIYKIDKDTPQGLRFDLTVPFARYVANNLNDLPMPFPRYQIGKVYRGERAQAGRFREFYQCDIDIAAPVERLGKGSSNRILLTLANTLKNILENTSILKKQFNFEILVGHRAILNQFFEENNLSDKSTKILQIIDDIKKIGEEKVCEKLKEIDLSDEDIKKTINLINCSSINDLKSFSWKNIENIKPFIEELEYVIKSNNKAVLDLSITRGLDYYTGIVFETFIEGELSKYGSMMSGGQYDGLINTFLPNQNIGGIGGSIGLSRLFDILDKEDLFKDIHLYEFGFICELTGEKIEEGFDFSKSHEIFEEAEAIIKKELKEFRKTSSFTSNTNKIYKKYSKNIPVILILENNEFKVKNMLSNEQEVFTNKEDAISKAKELLAKL
ncbi:MAG: histidine--tRNA ligase family protein [Alphaproteobacteria bacterium]|nr:histidine--tRNA ligase family protein [Alphaproteobacteria bacterium]